MRLGVIIGPVLTVLSSGGGPGAVLADEVSERAWSTEKPSLLRCAEESRSAVRLRTARIDWVRELVSGPAKGVRFYTTLIGGNRVARINHGDEHGRDVAVSDTALAGPLGYLVEPDGVWRYEQRNPLAQLLPRSEAAALAIYDLRLLGLCPIRLDVPFEEEVRAAGHPTVEYRVFPDDGLECVAARSGDVEVRWWIDTAKDCSPVRTAVYRRGEPVGERRIDLRHVDGVWFPSRVRSYQGGSDGPLLDVLDLYAVQINRPGHPMPLRPSDIGLEPGVCVVVTNREPGEARWWNGDELVSHEQWAADVRAGKRVPGPGLLRYRRQAEVRLNDADPLTASRSATANVVQLLNGGARLLSDWERYARDFIERHGLDRDQTQRALIILGDCQEEASAYITRRRGDFDVLDARLLAMTNHSDPARGDWTRLQSERDRLTAPLDEIFVSRLQPRLEALLTSEQRRRVTGPTTQPAKGD